MKNLMKATLLVMAMCILFAGCQYLPELPFDIPFLHQHEWQDATCDTPKTCATCDETEGEALGHTPRRCCYLHRCADLYCMRRRYCSR